MGLIFLRNRVSGVAPFDPATLFASGENGVWYEPSTSTCFTDTGGTTPATYGDAVAYLQDKSGNGNHVTQTSADARPTLARVPATGRRNLLERTEEFDNGYWALDNGSATNPVVTQDAGLDPNGDLTAERIQFDKTGGTFSRIQHSFVSAPLSSQRYTFSVWLKTYSGAGTQNVGLRIWDTGTNVVVTGTWQRFSVTTTINQTKPDCQILLLDGIVGNDETADVLAWGAQLDAGTSVTDYQKVVDEYDITEAGVDSLDYLSFETNDFLTISGSQSWYDQHVGTVAIAALTDSTAEQDVISNRGTGAKGKYAFSIRSPGTAWNYDNLVVGSNSVSLTASPINTPYVFYGQGDGTDIGAAINGATLTTAVDTYTTGNLDVYIGQTGNNTTYFSGRIYGLVLTDDNLTAEERSNTETYLANRSGVTL